MYSFLDHLLKTIDLPPLHQMWFSLLSGEVGTKPIVMKSHSQKDLCSWSLHEEYSSFCLYWMSLYLLCDGKGGELLHVFVSDMLDGCDQFCLNLGTLFTV